MGLCIRTNHRVCIEAAMDLRLGTSDIDTERLE